MRPEVLRQQLLPMSGVGVIAPWLVIAPPGEPVIRLDLRLLDRVEILPEAEDRPRCQVVLSCSDLDVALYIADGPDAAARITEAAAAAVASAHALANNATSQHVGRLVTLSSSPDGEPGPSDPLAGRSFELSRETMRIGRAGNSDIVL